MSEPLVVWAVHYQNNFPREVTALWSTKELAERFRATLEGDWEVEKWVVDGDMEELLIAEGKGPRWG